MSPANQECIEACNGLLRGELAAVETYRQAQEKFAGRPQAETLAKLRAMHESHASIIRDHVVSMGGEASAGSGAWGTFAQAVEGTAKLFGESSALQALIQGEKQGIKDYEEALEDEHVMDSINAVYRSEFIPTLRRNVTTLEGLQTTV